MDFDRRAAVPSHVLARELEGEMVLLNLDSESYFGLDLVGTRIWTKVSTKSSVQEAYEELLGEYDVEADRLRSDMERLLGELVEKGLLVLDDS